MVIAFQSNIESFGDAEGLLLNNGGKRVGYLRL